VAFVVEQCSECGSREGVRLCRAIWWCYPGNAAHLVRLESQMKYLIAPM
jgi:hypothetical protein